MCVILDIEPTAKIPDNMLELACDINPDGFGLAWIEKGVMKVTRSIDKNDFKTIGKELNRLHPHKRVLHLRFSTAGEVNMENNHPMTVLANRRGPQLLLFHNGTLYNYKELNDKLSDTFYFNKKFVQPLAARVEAFGGVRKLLDDTFFQRFMSKEIGASSVVVLLDRFGHVLRFNESKGKQFEGFWASNDYSFDKDHYRSSQSKHKGYGIYSVHDRYQPVTRAKQDNLPWEEVPSAKGTNILALEAWEIENRRQKIQGGILRSSDVTSATTLAKEMQACHDFIVKRKKEGSMPDVAVKDLNVRRKPFLELANLKDWKDIGHLKEPDLVEMCKLFPSAMGQLIIELAAMYRQSAARIAIKERELASLKGEKQ